MDVAIIQIGNSDDKLTQQQWSEFVSNVHAFVMRWSYPIYFHGCSVGSAPWQNACWVVDAQDHLRMEESRRSNILRQELKGLAKKYKQDSIALTFGNTEMITSRD